MILLTLGVLPIPEIILLAIRVSEDVITSEVDDQDQSDFDWAKFHVVEREVTGLQGIDKGDPSKVADGQHEAETIRGDVHCGEDGGLKTSHELSTPKNTRS